MGDTGAWRGVLWITGGTAMGTLIYASAKFAGEAASLWQIMLMRHVGALVILATGLVLTGRSPWQMRCHHPMTLLLRSLAGGLGTAATTAAAAMMPLADATAIGMLDGMLMVALGVVLLGEVIRWRHGCAIALCAGGAAVVVLGRGAFAEGTVGLPLGIAFAGALLGAVEGILIKHLASREEPLSFLLYTVLFSILLLAAPAALTWRSTDALTNLALFGMGAVALACMYSNVRGYRLAPMWVVGPVGYSWIVFATLLGLVWFDEIPTWATVAGALLIVTGGVWLARLPDPRRTTDAERLTPGVPP